MQEAEEDTGRKVASTPREWTVDEHEDGFDIVLESGYVIATVHSGSRADAELIARVPALEAALRFIASWQGRAHPPVIEMVERAIEALPPRCNHEADSSGEVCIRCNEDMPSAGERSEHASH